MLSLGLAPGLLLAADGDVTTPAPAPAPVAEAAPLPAPANVTDVPAPAADIGALDLGQLLGTGLRAGDLGSFGMSLGGQKATVEFHGFLTLDFNERWGDLANLAPDRVRRTPARDLGNTLVGATYFDLGQAGLVARGGIADRVFPELAFSFNHTGDNDLEELEVPWAFVDFRVMDWLVLRAGYIPVPLGAVNEYHWADFLRPTASLPLTNIHLIPGELQPWSEVGVQVRGRVPLGGERSFSYAAYVVNGGLSQVLPANAGEAAEGAEAGEGGEAVAGSGPLEGGDPADFEGEYTFTKVADKAFGGRASLVAARGVELGLSGYTGHYTVDGRRRILVLDADVGLEFSQVTLRGEAVLVQQEISGALVDKGPLLNSVFRPGAYVLFAYALTPRLEPYAQWDFVTRVDTTTQDAGEWFTQVLEGAVVRSIIGVAVRPLPIQVPRTLVKAEALVTTLHGERTELAIRAQVATGF
ncbi:MAG: hypothetical protein HY904_18640 [Deltaproteobacteria bacterium]|nr:hypothetical protein [Deltaproteobacteria bacterium]